MRLKPKYRRIIIDFSALVVVVLLVMGIYLGLQIVLATSTPWVAVASGSMSPALEVGDLLFIQGVPASSIQIGDIIVFNSPQGSRTIHRVVRIQTLPDGAIQFKTKGDANPSEDLQWIPEQNIYGRVLYRIPYLGWLSLDPTIPIIITATVIIVILLWPEKHGKRKR